MPLKQALAIALGIALAVFGGLYVLWRSMATDRTGLFLRATLSAVSISAYIGVGTTFLLAGWPNRLMGVGTGVHLYTLAFKAGFIAWHDLLGRTPLSPMFPSYLLGHAAAGGLFCIGSIAYGGALGVLGACLSAWWTVNYLWIASVMRKAVADPRPGARSLEPTE